MISPTEGSSINIFESRIEIIAFTIQSQGMYIFVSVNFNAWPLYPPALEMLCSHLHWSRTAYSHFRWKLWVRRLEDLLSFWHIYWRFCDGVVRSSAIFRVVIVFFHAIIPNWGLSHNKETCMKPKCYDYQSCNLSVLDFPSNLVCLPSVCSRLIVKWYATKLHISSWKSI